MYYYEASINTTTGLSLVSSVFMWISVLNVTYAVNSKCVW